MRYIVDRIEGDIAVLERDDLTFEDVPLSELPAGTRAHDCLELEGGEWRIDGQRTVQRKVAARNMLDRLLGR